MALQVLLTATALGAPKAKVAVLDVRSVGSVDPKKFDGVGAFIAAYLAEKRPDLQFIGSGDIRAMLGLERERQLLGCSDGSCLAEIGGALGVTYLVSTEGTQVGSTWVVTMALIEVGKSKVVKRVTLPTEREDKLAFLYASAAFTLAEAIPGGAVVGAAPEPDMESVKSYATPGWVLVGAGVAVAAAGAGCLGYSFAQQPNYASGTLSKSAAKTDAALAPVGWVGIGVGAAAAATGVALLLLPKRATGPSIAVAPTRNGGFASVTFEMP